MSYEIFEWEGIKDFYKNGSIILGNGASMALTNNFNYKNLKEKACDSRFMNKEVQELFTAFDTNDFEAVLRLVWQARTVNQILNISDYESIEEAYINIRECLITTIRQFHPSYESVEEKFPKMNDFLCQFKTVISLNYDLLIYWMMMWANRNYETHRYKDCFNGIQFNENWENLRKCIKKEKSNTLVFYPHGNLILKRNILESEYKVKVSSQHNLLEEIFNVWSDGASVPIFVSEGTSKQKETAIHNSSYLSTVYHEVIPQIQKSLTVYGWGFGEQDEHILKQILKSNVERIAVSVFGDNQIYCEDVISRIKRICKSSGKDFTALEIQFFHSDSKDCWIY